MIRVLRRGYVEAVGLVALTLLGIGTWRAIDGAGSGILLAAAPWLISIVVIGSGKVYIARHPQLADWLWRATAAGAVVIAGTVGGAGSALLAVGGLAALVGYQTWYTRQATPGTALVIGRPLPDFSLESLDGTELTSAQLSQSPHVLLFYRGTWCPFCVAQVGALADSYRELERRGVRVALISPQPARDTRALAQRFDVAMDFYVDDQGAAAEALDIVQTGGVPLMLTAGTNGDTVVPSVVITDGDGIVLWVHHATDHRLRPEPTTFLEVLDRAGVGAG